jgi:hypothetical protein
MSPVPQGSKYAIAVGAVIVVDPNSGPGCPVWRPFLRAGNAAARSALKLCSAAKCRAVDRAGFPFPYPRRDFMADDWEVMTVPDKLDHLLSRLDTLERRLEEVLIHLSDLSNAVEAIELKLRQ